MENLKNSPDHIGEVLKRVKPEYLVRVYKVTSYKDVDDFLEQVAKLSGRLLKVTRFRSIDGSSIFDSDGLSCNLDGDFHTM